MKNTKTVNQNLKKRIGLLSASFACGLALMGAGQAVHADSVQIQAGDTLSALADKYATTVDNLEQLNNLPSDLIIAGNKLQVPAGATGAYPTQKASAQNQAVSQVESHIRATQPEKTYRPVQQTGQVAQSSQTQAPVQQKTPTIPRSQGMTQGNSSAKDWIAQHESGGSYTAQNGRFYGKYQLDISYLNGDTSAANQERVAQKYVQDRYGSWENAQAHWNANGWY